MFRGTTPTLKFTLPFDADGLSCAWITLAQNKKDIIDKPMTECTCAENVITVTLTQEETLLLNCDYKGEKQTAYGSKRTRPQSRRERTIELGDKCEHY